MNKAGFFYYDYPCFPLSQNERAFLDYGVVKKGGSW